MPVHVIWCWGLHSVNISCANGSANRMWVSGAAYIVCVCVSLCACLRDTNIS